MLTKLDTIVTSLKSEIEKFGNGNKTPATRARKILQEIKTEAQALRQVIQTKKVEASKKVEG